MKVYLAGLISTEKPESLEWREKAIPTFKQGIEVLTPMRGKHNLKTDSKDGGLTSSTRTPKDIVHRDFGDVSSADVILAHLEDFGSTRPMVGTLCELAWAWQMRTPVVAVAAENNYLMRNHPFIKEFVAHYFPSVEEAVNFINVFYGAE